MSESMSGLSKLRDDRIHQSDERRESIVATAEVLFLQQGLEHVSMRAIADEAGITPVTLYRYFPDKHHVAFQVAARMIRRIVLVSAEGTRVYVAGHLAGSILTDVPAFRQICVHMIDRFDRLRPAYQYIGLFDHLYARAYPTEDLARWYRNELIDAMGADSRAEQSTGAESEPAIGRYEQQVTILNTIMSFLEKMAARGPLMANEQGVPVSRQIEVFRRFIDGIIHDTL